MPATFLAQGYGGQAQAAFSVLHSFAALMAVGANAMKSVEKRSPATSWGCSDFGPTVGGWMEPISVCSLQHSRWDLGTDGPIDCTWLWFSRWCVTLWYANVRSALDPLWKKRWGGSFVVQLGRSNRQLRALLTGGAPMAAFPHAAAWWPRTTRARAYEMKWTLQRLGPPDWATQLSYGWLSCWDVFQTKIFNIERKHALKETMRIADEEEQ